jgi:hypothetical protein
MLVSRVLTSYHWSSSSVDSMQIRRRLCLFKLWRKEAIYTLERCKQQGGYRQQKQCESWGDRQLEQEQGNRQNPTWIDKFRYTLPPCECNFNKTDINLTIKIDPGRVNTGETNLSRFCARGGKILSYHSRNDEVSSLTSNFTRSPMLSWSPYRP